MGNEVTEVVETFPNSCTVKVHCLMCAKLMKFVDGISKIFPEIEAARPRCSSGIQALCSLNSAVDRAKSIVQYCGESSKLYLVFTGNVIVSRCERSRNLFVQSLSQIQTMVPVKLAIKISQIIEDLKNATFILESSEEEAEKAVRALFQDTSGTDQVEAFVIEHLKLAASRLHIKSKKSLLLEKRSIKKMLDKVGDADTTKKKLLRHLLYLLMKYGKLLITDQADNESPRHEGSFVFASSRSTSLDGQSAKEDSCVDCGKNEAQTKILSKSTPPVEFICPLSLTVMYEPVVIDSGQTFERAWIQKWFDEGNDECPKTKKKLTHLSVTPNIVIKDLISKWCKEHGITIPDPCMQPAALNAWEASYASIASFGSSVNDLCFQLDLSDVSLGSLDSSYNSESPHLKIPDGTSFISLPTHENARGIETKYLLQLAALSWEDQCKAVEDVGNYLVSNDRACFSMSSQNLVDPLIRFLKESQDRHDVTALKSGSQLLLRFVSKRRGEHRYFGEGVFALLASLLDSEVGDDAVTIIAVFSSHQYYRSKIAASGALTFILMNIENRTKKFQESAIKILCNLSTNSENHSTIVSLDCIPKLVPFMSDISLAKYAIVILQKLCETEEARISVAKTDGCIASIAKLLDDGSHEEQEHAVAVLLSLCSQRNQYCQLVVEEGVITSLCSISVNGSDRARISASELLRILRDFDYNDSQECSESDHDVSRDSDGNSKEKRPSTATSGFFGKFSMFSKPISLSSKKKK